MTRIKTPEGEDGKVGLGESAWYGWLESLRRDQVPLRLRSPEFIAAGPVRPGYRKPYDNVSANMLILWVTCCAGAAALTASAKKRERMVEALRSHALHYYDHDREAHMGGEQLSTDYGDHHLTANQWTVNFGHRVPDLAWLAAEAEAWLRRHIAALLPFRAPADAHQLVRFTTFRAGNRFNGKLRTSGSEDYWLRAQMADAPPVLPFKSDWWKAEPAFLYLRPVERYGVPGDVDAASVRFKDRVVITYGRDGMTAEMRQTTTYNAPQFFAGVNYRTGYRRFVFEPGHKHGGTADGAMAHEMYGDGRPDRIAPAAANAEPVPIGDVVEVLTIDSQGIRRAERGEPVAARTGGR
jgi:hypothetical protein